MTNESLRQVVARALNDATENLEVTKARLAVAVEEVERYNNRRDRLETEIAELTEAFDAIEKAE